MQTLTVKLLNAVRDRKGATAIEYGLIAAGVGVAIATVIFLIGDDLETLFTSIQEFLTPAS